MSNLPKFGARVLIRFSTLRMGGGLGGAIFDQDEMVQRVCRRVRCADSKTKTGNTFRQHRLHQREAETEGITMTNYVALWSHSLKAFHVESVDDMLENNNIAFAHKRACIVDYVPLFIGTESECREIVKKLSEKL